jgi:hypothetical protein
VFHWGRNIQILPRAHKCLVPPLLLSMWVCILVSSIFQVPRDWETKQHYLLYLCIYFICAFFSHIYPYNYLVLIFLKFLINNHVILVCYGNKFDNNCIIFENTR